MINALPNQVIFLGDFDSKHKQFECVKPNKSGQTLVNIAEILELFYVNQLSPNRHTHEDPVHGTSDILDTAFLSPGLSSRDISFRIADDHKFQLTSHSSRIHHLQHHTTDLTKPMMTYFITH